MICCAVLLAIPFGVHAEVRINEIAWMGTNASANDEWVELYNSDSSSVNVSGWTLNALDGTPEITLSGSIDSGSYYLLERTDDTSASSATADHIYTGSLGNSGEYLELRNADGLIDEIDARSEWLAGDNESKDTMQWSGGTWITAAPTPGLKNRTAETVEDKDSSSSNDGIDDDSSEHGDSEEIKKESDTSSKDVLNKDDTIDTYNVTTYVDPVVVEGIPARIDIVVTKNGDKRLKGVHKWSFGDGVTYITDEYPERSEFRRNHTYHQAGTYTLVFEYYRSVLSRDPDITHTITIEVLPADIEIESVEENSYIGLRNATEKAINIEGWRVYSGDEYFSVPDNTVIQPDSVLHLSQTVMDISIGKSALLQHPNKEIIDTFVPVVKNSVTMETATGQTEEIKKKNTEVHEKGTTVTPIEKDIVEPSKEIVIDNSEKSSDDMIVWYLVALALVCCGSLGALSYMLYQRHIQKKDTDEQYPIDDIEIIED